MSGCRLGGGLLSLQLPMDPLESGAHFAGRSLPVWLMDECMQQHQQQLLHYLHPAYAPQVATYQLALKGKIEEENN
ncbi:unnamed protein product [Protopolystoma xenopodis]|uniref:Uncharacterized protein n=1 Tax=Protopolystoma xenopodis TaxID=117903 RepID=A0A3S5A7Q6_9PLAT|nr:unnamed protein product [Protopolystoma xenopodis]